MRTNLGY